MELLIQAHRHSLGGFDVGRVLPSAQRRMVGPFVFWDHMGPVAFPPHIPKDTDVRPHPHIGLSTITYLFDGLRESGGRMDGIQAWVALPLDKEETDPAFDHYGREALPQWSEAGMTATLIAGSAFGETNAVKTLSPLFYVHAYLETGGRIGLPTGHPERAAYVARGRIEAGGREFTHGGMLIFAKGESPTLTALEPSDVMLLGGEPLGPRHVWWNFVSSSRERIEQAKADWRAGRIALPPQDHDEFIPLPPEPPPPAPEPMS